MSERPVPDLTGVPCRDCGVPALRVEWRLVVRPYSDLYSLAGVQTKMAAVEHPWCVCDDCGAESKGK